MLADKCFVGRSENHHVHGFTHGAVDRHARIITGKYPGASDQGDGEEGESEQSRNEEGAKRTHE